MNVEITKKSKEEMDAQGVTGWPIWEKEPSQFDWSYDEKETCYFLEGKVEVDLPDGKTVTIEQGDLAVFPKGLSCKWNVQSKVRKHYHFG